MFQTINPNLAMNANCIRLFSGGLGILLVAMPVSAVAGSSTALSNRTVVDTRNPFPEIVVEQPAGSSLVDGTAKKSFGTVKVGRKSVAKVFTIRNIGVVKLSGLELKKNGANANDFHITKLSTNSLSPGASTTFKVTFKPTAKGTRNAAVHIMSNDANENPFDIKIVGLGSR